MTDPILVTGASGLIGAELVPRLRREPFRVVTTGRAGALERDHYRCDLTCPEQTAELVAAVRPATIIHLAGGTDSSRQQVYRKNVLPTVYLLHAAARLPHLPYCLVIGSAAEYGRADGELITESSPLQPVTEYGRAKLAQTTLAESIARAAGLPLTILRPFNLVSPHLPTSTALGSMRQQLLSGTGQERMIECGRLDIVRDFVPLSMVVEAIRRLALSPAPGQAFNVCSGTGIELGSLLQALAERLGVVTRIVQKPELLAIPAGPRVVGDPTRLARVIGLRMTATAAGLAEILVG